MTKNSIIRAMRDFLGIDDTQDSLRQIIEKQDLINAKVQNVEEKMSEITRAVAVLALVQSNLIREIGDLSDRDAKKKTKAAYSRKSGSDFTN